MTAAMNLLGEIARLTAQAFVAGLWQGILLIAAVALGLRLVPRVSASVRFAVWGFAFALAMLTPALQVRSSAVQASSTASAMFHLSAMWVFVIAGLWAALTGGRVVQLMRQALGLRRVWRQAVPVAVSDEMQVILRESGRSAVLCTSEDVDAPSVIGFFAPRLLIPAWLFEQVTDAELRHIVLHECEHLRRGDDWINLAQKIGMALFPLNPALLWVDRQLSLERELACDAGVVASTAAPFDYAHCLTRLAEHRHCRRVALSLSAWSRQPKLVARVHSLLRPMRQMSALQARASVALLGVGLAGGAVEMARAPRFVAFTDTVAAPVAAAVPVMPSAVAVPVVYRQTEQPHETLLKAVMPSALHTRSAAKPRVKQPLQAEVQRVDVERNSQQPHMVLTKAMQSEPEQEDAPRDVDERRPVYRMSTDFSPSYAAIPFGDGWLIVQL